MNKLKDFQNNYNPYYDLYLKNLKFNDSIFERLEHNKQKVYGFFNRIEDKNYMYSYAENKWNISQVLQHIIDTERIFCYRALKIVRDKNAIINSYDHESYALNTKHKTKAIHLEDYKNNRLASISLFKTFSDEVLIKTVSFSEYEFCVGLIPFIICGHELHHLRVIQTKYL